MSALAWLGRQGTRATATLVFVGIAVPPVDRVLKGFVPEAVFVLLCIAFARVDTAALFGYLRRPALVIAATAWTMLAIPSLYGFGCLALGVEARAPDLFLQVMLQAVAPPLMAAPALAALMGFDATLVLVTLVAGSIVAPLTAPFFAHAFIGPVLKLSPLALGTKLFVIVGGALLAAVVIRRAVGSETIRRYKPEIDGFNILVMFVFVAAVMEDLGARIVGAPLTVIALGLLAFAAFFGVFGLTRMVFARAGRERALAVALVTAQRNMGIMLAVTAEALPGFSWLYFAMSQFPIYLSPQILRPLGASSPSAARCRAVASPTPPGAG